jgi:hypothetical protein
MMSTIWGIRGVDLTRRKAVIEAARHANMTVGEWISAAIDRQLARPSPSDQLIEVLQKLEDHDKRLSYIEKGILYGFKGAKNIK